MAHIEITVWMTESLSSPSTRYSLKNCPVNLFVTVIKKALFTKLLHLHPGWHDKEEINIGKLTSLLSTDID